MDEFDNLDGLLAAILRKSVKTITKSDSNETNGLASSRQIVSVTFEDGSKLNLFLKVRQSGSQAEHFDETLQIFQREAKMYNDIIPMLAKYQEDTGKDVQFPVKEMFPKFYGAGFVQKDFYLVFEDIITDTARIVTAKDQFHSNDQVGMCLEQLGAFHAVSHAYKTKTGISFLEKFPILKDGLFEPTNNNMFIPIFIGMFRSQLHILDAVRIEVLEKNPLVSTKIKTTCSEEDIFRLLSLSADLMTIVHRTQLPPIEPGAVITHGDFHMWNVAFDNKESVKFFDLQVSRYTSGLTDVHQYLVQVTTPETRRKHLDQFLTCYLQGFEQSCKDLGVNEPILNKEDIAEEYKRISPWGLLFGMAWILTRFVTDQESFSTVQKLLETETSDRNTRKIVEYLDKSGPKIWWAVQVLFDLIVEIKEISTIDMMESFKE